VQNAFVKKDSAAEGYHFNVFIAGGIKKMAPHGVIIGTGYIKCQKSYCMLARFCSHSLVPRNNQVFPPAYRRAVN
jgi:hypothetical protein